MEELNELPITTTLGDLKQLFSLASNLLQEDAKLTPDSWFFPFAVGFIGDIFEKAIFLLEAFFTTPSKGVINIGTIVADLTFPEITPPRDQFIPTEEHETLQEQYQLLESDLTNANQMVYDLQKEVEELKNSLVENSDYFRKFQKLDSGFVDLVVELTAKMNRAIDAARRSKSDYTAGVAWGYKDSASYAQRAYNSST